MRPVTDLCFVPRTSLDQSQNKSQLVVGARLLRKEGVRSIFDRRQWKKWLINFIQFGI